MSSSDAAAIKASCGVLVRLTATGTEVLEAAAKSAFSAAERSIIEGYIAADSDRIATHEGG